MLSFGHRRTERLAAIYWLALALAALALAVTYLLLRSRTGIGLTATRDNEEGAAAIGVDITFSRIVCFLGTAPFLGMAGAIILVEKRGLWGLCRHFLPGDLVPIGHKMRPQ